MNRKNLHFEVFNNTDGVFASPEPFETRCAASAFIGDFRKRFARQGYYLTSGRQRIPVEQVELVIVEMEVQKID